jgi:hypothetical protein
MNVPMPRPDVWVHEQLVVGASSIAGSGLFAAGPLEAGTRVIRLGGTLATSEELAARIDAANADPRIPYVDTISLAENLHLVLPSGTTVHYGNHSCDPNLWHQGPYDMVARRDIGVGEELTIDYGTQSALPEFSMTCTCATKRCRGHVTGDDWRLPELRALYRGHWVPVLESRINAR